MSPKKKLEWNIWKEEKKNWSCKKVSQKELLELLSLVKVNYPYFKVDPAVEKAWYEVTHYFKYEDVKHNLEIAMTSERFQKDPPTIYYLTQNLTPIHESVSFEKRIVFCPICKRALNQEEEKKHFERCSSVRYIVRQYKRWNGNELNRRDLFEMSEEEFEKKYNELLKYVETHTDDVHEKIRIGFIFNPPSIEQAKKFLGG
jgi:hypothetical protein